MRVVQTRFLLQRVKRGEGQKPKVSQPAHNVCISVTLHGMYFGQSVNGLHLLGRRLAE